MIRWQWLAPRPSLSQRIPWLEESLPQQAPQQRALDANPDDDSFPNFAEYLLGLDALQYNHLAEVLSFEADGSDGYLVQFDQRSDPGNFQLVLERVNLDTGETTPLESSSSSTADGFTSKVFTESGDSLFLRLALIPFPVEVAAE